MKSKGLLCIVIAVTFGYTQAPDTLWTKTYGGTGDDVGNSIKQTSDGGYIIAGFTVSFGAGGQDVWLIKIDSIGDTVWTKTYGGADSEWAEDIQPTTDSGYIIAANIFNSGYNTTSMWLIKTDSHGDTIWTRIYDGGDHALSVQQTSDGGYIVSGTRPCEFIIEGHMILMKTNAIGDTLWCKYYFVNQEYLVPWANCVRETFDGGYIVAGFIGTLGLFIPAFLLKTDANGDSIWLNDYVQDSTLCILNSVQQTPDSGYIACGGYGLDYLDPTSALWIVKTDINGDSLWTKTYGDSLLELQGTSVQLTNDNGYVFTGICGDDIWENPDLFLLKTNENGDSLWCTVYGENDYADRGNEVITTDDGGFIIVGYTGSYGAGGADVWVIKTEPDVGIEENESSFVANKEITATILRGPLHLPKGSKCTVFDITGRVVEPNRIQPGIYFIEIDGEITRKVVKVR